ncbi:uncharacterized protein FOMMEDRAFT_150762 [Fomitiporia mediterranea MF3/22]|uniref:uncharacterized protein n=1 Tax=Fomitiporia mediterranea (strain MF3/22) TaxID=694068 RepID=UPI00044080F1|nr:uncharacterized protein FOMMEDRAFT_150762 [Fomitiporia mediterranea MF3/22]EJD08088.1 hypothetical protein FOMMEDRAFT_150762 [Fomitiporia mediterranea MF3/22]
MPNLVYYINKRQKELVPLHQPSEEDILFGSIPKNVRDVLRQLTASKAANSEEMLFRVAKENHIQIDEILLYCEWLQAERYNGHGLASAPFSEIPEEIKETLKSLLRMNPTANETIRKIWASRFTSRIMVKQEVVLSYLKHLEEDGVGGGDKGQSSLSDSSRKQLTRTTTVALHSSTQGSAFPGVAPQEQSRKHSSPSVRDGRDIASRSTMPVHTPGAQHHHHISIKHGHNGNVAESHPTILVSTSSTLVHDARPRTHSLSPVRDGHDYARRSATLVNSPEARQQNHITGNDEHITGAARSRVKLPTPISVLSGSVPVGQVQSRTNSVSLLSPLQDGPDDTRRSATLVRTPDMQHQTQMAGEDKNGAGIYNPTTALTEIREHPVLPQTPHSPPVFETVFPVTSCNSRDSLTSEQVLLCPSGELRKPTQNVEDQHANVQAAITPESGLGNEGHVQPRVPLMCVHGEDVTNNDRVENVGDRAQSRWDKTTGPIRENPISTVRLEVPSDDMNGRETSTAGITNEAAMRTSTVCAVLNMENEVSPVNRDPGKYSCNIANQAVRTNKFGSESHTGDEEGSELKGMDVAPERSKQSRDDPPEPSDPSKETHDEARMDIDLEPPPRNMRELIAWIEKREGPLDNLLLIGEQIKAGMKK